MEREREEGIEGGRERIINKEWGKKIERIKGNSFCIENLSVSLKWG